MAEQQGNGGQESRKISLLNVQDVLAIEEMTIELMTDRVRQIQESLERLMARRDTLRVNRENIQEWLKSNPPDEVNSASRGINGSDGLPINTLSDIEKLRLSIQIAAAGTYELENVCIHGAELMPERERETLLGVLEAAGLKFFVAADSIDAPATIQQHCVARPVSDPTAELRALFSEAQLTSPLVTEATLGFAPVPVLASDEPIAIAPGFDEPVGVVEEPAAASGLVAESKPEIYAAPGFDDDVAPGFDEGDGVPPGFDDGYEDSLPLPVSPAELAPVDDKSKSVTDDFNFGF